MGWTGACDPLALGLASPSHQITSVERLYTLASTDSVFTIKNGVNAPRGVPQNNYEIAPRGVFQKKN